jgi:hypothetical protein
VRRTPRRWFSRPRQKGPPAASGPEHEAPVEEPAAKPPVRASGPVEGVLGEPGGSPGEAASHEPEPEPPEPERERKRALAAVRPERGPEPELEPEPEPEVVPLVLRETSPRAWNIWELERIAAKGGNGGDAVGAEERALLLIHMRPFANAAGDLPLEFDPLVRETFGAGLAGVPAGPR